MIFFIILIMSASIFWGWIKEKNIYNPLILFNGFISCISILASLQLFGMNPTSNKTYFVNILGLVGFLIGVIICDTFYKNNSTNIINNEYKKKYILNKNIVILAIMIMIIYSSYRFIQIVPLLLSGYSFDYIRMVYFGTEIMGIEVSNISSVIEIYLNLPLLYAIAPIIVIEIISNKKKADKKLIFLFIIWLSLSILISGGRTILYIIGMECVICFIIFNKNFKLNTKTKFRISFFIIAAIVFMYYMSINRKSNGQSYEFLKTLYTNFTGAMPHMSYRFETINIESNYTYGFTLFSGILRPIMLLYKFVVGVYPEVYQNTLDIGSQLQTAIDLGNNMTFNAYVTPFFYFYYDLGYIGVLLDSIIYGMVCEWFYIKMKKNYSNINIAFYLLIVQGIFTSMIRYSFILIYYVLAFIYLRFMFSRNKKILLQR